ncbi:hypothetical protein LTR95_006950 [Oleoguttula sp. CCFEE 5521]
MTSIPTSDTTFSSQGQLFELARVIGKGHGLVASQSIKRGTCIIEEFPIVAVQPVASEQKLNMPLERQIMALSSEALKVIDELYHDPLKVDHRLLDKSRLYAIRMAVFRTNSVSMGEIGQYGTGLFPLCSRLNHSCNAKVHHSFNIATGKETVYAVRQINKGEELVTSYIPTAWRTKKQRAELLQQGWDFLCTCKVCVGPNAAKSEKRRERMLEIDQALAMFEKGLRPVPGLQIPVTERQALGLSEEMLNLIREDAITDFQLAQVYRECGKYSLKSGNIEKAIGYARKECDVERYCIGTETAHMKEGMKGVEYWLAHLLAEREKIRANHHRRGNDKKKA